MKKHILFFALFTLLAAVSVSAQPTAVQYCFPEFSLKKTDPAKQYTILDWCTLTGNTYNKYSVVAYINPAKRTISNVVFKRPGKPDIALNKVKYIPKMTMESNPGCYGMPAYACTGTGTSMTFYMLLQETSNGLIEFLFYYPGGPQNISN